MKEILTMILAALGDIHGNLPAFEAVLQAIDREGIQTVVHTGDLVAGFPYSKESINLVRDRNLAGVQGEMDKLALRFVRKRASLQDRLDEATWNAVEAAVRSCSSEQIEYLRRLPRKSEFQLDGMRVAVAHGTLASQTRIVDISDDTHCRRQREIKPADVYIFGRTHVAAARVVDGALFVNPGSVGFGTGAGSDASFAIIDTESEPWRAELRVVSYAPRG